MTNSLIGVGLYSAADAQFLTRIPALRMRRWIRGYKYHVHGEPRFAEPLWESEIDQISDALELSFRDLTELLFVDAFRRAGLSLQHIRLGMAEAQSIIGEMHPFSTAQFRTDGRTIFVEKAKKAGEPDLIDLLKRQHVFHRFVEPTFKTLDFEGNIPVRWWPVGRQKSVLIDPSRSFGRPIVESGVATDVLADAYKLTKSYKNTAIDFGISESEVRNAVTFQTRETSSKLARAA